MYVRTHMHFACNSFPHHKSNAEENISERDNNEYSVVVLKMFFIFMNVCIHTQNKKSSEFLKHHNTKSILISIFLLNNLM